MFEHQSGSVPRQESFEALFRDLLRDAVDQNVALARTAWDQQNRFWTVAEVCEHTGLSVTGLRDLRDNPRKDFPQPVGFDTKPRWIVAEIMEWARANRILR